MTTTLTTTRHDHPPQPGRRPERPASTPRRVSLLDRAALRLGLLLITWGRRANHRSREQLGARYRNDRARERRELDAQRLLLLTIPPR